MQRNIGPGLQRILFWKRTLFLVESDPGQIEGLKTKAARRLFRFKRKEDEPVKYII